MRPSVAYDIMRFSVLGLRSDLRMELQAPVFKIIIKKGKKEGRSKKVRKGNM